MEHYHKHLSTGRNWEKATCELYPTARVAGLNAQVWTQTYSLVHCKQTTGKQLLIWIPKLLTKWKDKLFDGGKSRHLSLRHTQQALVLAEFMEFRKDGRNRRRTHHRRRENNSIKQTKAPGRHTRQQLQKEWLRACFGH